MQQMQAEMQGASPAIPHQTKREGQMLPMMEAQAQQSLLWAHRMLTMGLDQPDHQTYRLMYAADTGAPAPAGPVPPARLEQIHGHRP
jgi:hypothetical protein